MEKYPKNLLFLDFDGCLTSVKDGTYFNTDPDQYHASYPILRTVMKFCRYNDAKVVIASNWRKFDDDGTWSNSNGTFKNPLPTLKSMLNECYFGTLPATRHIKKSDAMLMWLKEHEDFEGGYVIFDDDEREGYQNMSDYGISYHFILVDSHDGITQEDLDKAKGML